VPESWRLRCCSLYSFHSEISSDQPVVIEKSEMFYFFYFAPLFIRVRNQNVS